MSEDWRRLAACRGMPTGLFYLDGPGAGQRYKSARRICSGCPVVAECLAYALAHESDFRTRHGVWGGKSPAQRWALARRAAIAVRMAGEPDAPEPAAA